MTHSTAIEAIAASATERIAARYKLHPLEVLEFYLSQPPGAKRKAFTATLHWARDVTRYRVAEGSSLTFVSTAGLDRHNNELWLCDCKCGKRVSVAGRYVKNGNRKSCGCLRIAAASKNGLRHGHARNEGRTTPTYRSWSNMRHRCVDASNPTYGAAGITVCERWSQFSAFLEDMGERQPGTSIDRIDNSLGYFKDNCRWATTKTQNINRSVTKLNEVSVALIRHMRRRGARRTDLAHAFGVGNSTISRAASRTSW